MKQLATGGGRLGCRRHVLAGGIIAVMTASLIAEGPHSAIADELSSGLPIPQEKPETSTAQRAPIEQMPFFEMASLNLRTLMDKVSTGELFDDEDLPLSRADFDRTFHGDNRPAFSLATLNLRTFAPPERDIAPIHVMSDADAKRYRLIFDLQVDGNWEAADALIDQLEDPVLMGHVLFQRYMHPTAYRSKFEELASWMEAYGDHPSANQIYALALKRKPAGATSPARPRMGRSAIGAMENYGFVPRRYRSDRERSTAARRQVKNLMQSISNLAARGRPDDAYAKLNTEGAKRLLDQHEFDLARAEVATSYFHQAQYQRAIDLGNISARSDLHYLDGVNWTVGLAHWKLGEYKEAAAEFVQVANSNNVSPWKRSAAAFWAARSYRELGDKTAAQQWLEAAANYPGTFYGLLSVASLNDDPDFHWQTPSLNAERLALLQENPAAKRGLALIQVGQKELAEEELRRVNPRRNRAVEEALVAVAEDVGLPGLAVRVGSRFRPDEAARYDTALYPIPPWTPDTGFQVDRALVFGFMRQESRFDPTAQSGVGASGLMQLMPRTAKYMGDDALYDGSDRDQLFEPAVNIELGQRYLAYLLQSRFVNNDLMLLAAAYNAGPGNLQHWRRRVSYHDDPLFFIESIPIHETRVFVERVLTNVWIYRMRFNQPTPSLDALARGQRPLYEALETTPLQVAVRASN